MSTTNVPNAKPAPPKRTAAQAAAKPAAAPDAELVAEPLPLAERIKLWFIDDAPSWLLSAMVHMVIFLILGLVMGRQVIKEITEQAPVFQTVKAEEPKEPEIERFAMGDPSVEPSELSPDTLDMGLAAGGESQEAQEAKYYDESPKFEEQGGGTPTGSETGAGGLGYNIKASGLGPVLHGGGGAEAGKGTGTGWGRGGGATGFGGRGQGHREALLLRYHGTKKTELAVAAALNWLARHQHADGSWTIDHKQAHRCTDGSCTGQGGTESVCGATALGLLPFLGSGVTHQIQTKSANSTSAQYRTVVTKALRWLTSHQKPNGDLSDGGHNQMYAHGLATIALCEAFGMTNDYSLQPHALAAIRFIESGQNADGAWRYEHGTPDSDTSVYGWQMMALKSGQMASLPVDAAKLEAGRKWLAKASGGGGGTSESLGRFSYTGGRGGTPCMSSVGLLITQYLGAPKSDPTIVNGVQYLMQHVPKQDDRNIYYWYYATQVIHHLGDDNWDKWNRQMRTILVESQCKTGCALGSWDPAGAHADAWGRQGGRMMVTSLSALTLEVYYRHLPLYQLDKAEAADER